ncbi:MAG: acetylglutamate kinase [Prevotellaceae bacterium]|jgi:acetylglutamate kinase|nr:acetylglutamate kinase [Prevotellaceae bacterium]
MKQSVNIIKIGGNVIDNEAMLEVFLRDFASLGRRKILVHGGGKMATRLSERLSIPAIMHEGRRITDDETLKIVTMVYAGWINKHIVALLQKMNCMAIGLSGPDANLIPAVRRSPVPIDFGHAGDVAPEKINISFLQNILEQGITPVFCAITHDGCGGLLNSNADTIASSLASSLSQIFSTRLIYCFEKDGVLSNPDDEKSVIKHIRRDTYQEMKESGTITAGMIPKIDNAFKAIDAGVSEVLIKHARNLNNDLGTTIL